jgi:hypothetical protein
MKRVLLGICLAASIVSCTHKSTNLNVSPTPQGTSGKLSTIQFQTMGPEQITLQVHYSGNNPDTLIGIGFGKIVYVYNGNNPEKIIFEDASNHIGWYYEFTYNSDNQVDTRKLYDPSGTSGQVGFWNGYKYHYANGLLMQLTFIDSNGNTPEGSGYIQYAYDRYGSLTSMNVYSIDDSETYTYTTNEVPNNLQNILPQYQVIGLYTQSYNWDIWDDDTHLENQFRNPTLLSSESWVFKQEPSQAWSFNYNYIYDTTGKVLISNDNSGDIVKYTYQ